MRQIISKKTAIEAIVLVLALIAILSIFPLRVWTDVFSYSTGAEIVSESDPIKVDHTLLQQFVTQYDRLSGIKLYVSDVERGRYLSVAVRDENSTEILRTYVDSEGHDLPGYIDVPLELNVEVGKVYYLVFSSCRSKYNLGYEDVPETAGYVGSVYYDWNEIPARHVAVIYDYRVPMSKGLSLLFIAGIAVICAIILTAVGIYYKKNPDRNTIITVEKAVKFVANPLAAVIFLSLAIMVFPLRLFDKRVIDIVFYEIGIIITAGIVFYSINHKAVRLQKGISFWQDIQGRDRLVYILMMFCIAMAIWNGCEYMNGIAEIFHTLSVRKMVIWLLVLVVLTFSLQELLNTYNIAWVILSSCLGSCVYAKNALAETEKEYDLHNAALRYLIIIVILAGLIVINLLLSVTSELLKKKRGKNTDDSTCFKTGRFGAILLLFLLTLIIFRNNRVWGIELALVYAAIYLRLYFFKGIKDWYRILCGGLMLNFAISLGFSLLHRYFAGYLSGRFAFIFHTVTVTAEYLTFMGAAATVMLVIKIVAFPKCDSFVDLFKSAWKEMVLFGWIMSYAIFTVSRTAYVACSVTIFAVVCVVAIRHKKQFARIILLMIMSVILCFPAAFTMQRIVPTVVADPVHYTIDDTDNLIRGGAAWSSSNFMCVERFVNLFSTKILGRDNGDYVYPDDFYNYGENGMPIYDIYGYPFEGSEEDPNAGTESGKNTVDQEVYELLASNGMTRAEQYMLLSILNSYVDESNALDVISNGRITIYSSYLKELNLTGHEKMGALLPNGEPAVHAHNTFLQVSYDNGIIAGVLFVIVVIGALVGGLSLYAKKEDEDPLSLLAFAMTVGFAVAGLTEWVFHLGNPMTIAFMLALPGIIFKEKKHE